MLDLVASAHLHIAQMAADKILMMLCADAALTLLLVDGRSGTICWLSERLRGCKQQPTHLLQSLKRQQK